MITSGETDAPHFPISWRNDPNIIIGFDLDSLSPNEQEVVQALSDFKFISSHALITLDRGDNNGISEYFAKFCG